GSSDYLSNAGNAEDIHAIFRDLEMPYELIGEMAEYCKTKNIAFMSTPFSIADARAVDPFVAVHKVASYEVNHRRLLQFAAATKKPLIVSTGAAELSEIGAALELLRAREAGPL